MSPSFTPFSFLPLELRLKIWRSSLPQRLIPIIHTGGPHPGIQRPIKTYTPTLTLLSVNQESRTEILRKYVLVYDNHNAEPRFYFNSHLDIIYLDITPGSWFDIVRSIDASISNPQKRVKSLAIRQKRADIKMVKGGFKPWDCIVKELILVGVTEREGFGFGEDFIQGCRIVPEILSKSDEIFEKICEEVRFFRGGLPKVRFLWKGEDDMPLKVEDLVFE